VSSGAIRRDDPSDPGDTGAAAPRPQRLEIAETTAELDHLEHELMAAQGQVQDLTEARDELARRLALRTEELDATVSALRTLERSTETIESAVSDVRGEARELRSERAQLAARIDTLTIHAEGLARAIADRDTALGELRRSNADLQAQIVELQAQAEQARQRTTALEALERERQRTVEDLRRLSHSRAWRLGHGATRLIRRLTFRPIKTGGAVEVLIKRLEAPPALTPGTDNGAQEEPPPAVR
jgi:chromosome segregation ATPase